MAGTTSSPSAIEDGTSPEDTAVSQGFRLPRLVRLIAQNSIIVILPFFLILLNAGILMTDVHLNLQYNSPWLPPDLYGMPQEARQGYARLALAYLWNDEGIEFLANQTFADGAPLYNERELAHMVDVKIVTQELTRLGIGLGVALAIAVALLASFSSTRIALFRSLMQGGLLTIGLIVVGLVLVVTSFNWLFTMFHALFFEGDSWIFAWDDTLIRLFPIEFWAVAFALMFGGALLQATLIAGGAWWILKRQDNRQREANPAAGAA